MSNKISYQLLHQPITFIIKQYVESQSIIQSIITKNKKIVKNCQPGKHKEVKVVHASQLACKKQKQNIR